MSPDRAQIESCRIIAEFEDDASSFATAEPQYIPVPPLPLPPPFWGIEKTDFPPSPPPTAGDTPPPDKPS